MKSSKKAVKKEENVISKSYANQKVAGRSGLYSFTVKKEKSVNIETLISTLNKPLNLK